MDDKTKAPCNSSIQLWAGSFLGCALKRVSPWVLNIEKSDSETCLSFISDERLRSVTLESIIDIRIEASLFWSTVVITTDASELSHAGVWRWKAKRPAEILRKQIIGEIKKLISEAEQPLAKLEEQVKTLLSTDRYLRFSDITRFKDSIKNSFDPAIAKLSKLFGHPFAKDHCDDIATRGRIDRIAAAQDASSSLIKRRNDAFITAELSAYSNFFDIVEKTPLTEEQRYAAVIFEDRNLLVAAAGSGKSSTLVGKAGYALMRKLFKSNEIVALAFNKKAALELNERVNLRIKPWLKNNVVKAHTFHGLGYSIVRKLARTQSRKVRLAKEDSQKPRLKSVLDELISQSPEFTKNWVLFLSMCREPIPSDNAFNSKEDYDSYVDRQRAARRDGQPATFQTLSGDLVRSVQELAIANWLYIQGVPFRYEKPFSPVPEGWPKYEPDFYFPDINVWYEHFALDASGIAPSHFHNYAKQAQEKRDWMAQHAAGRFFETRSHEYYEDTLFPKLKKQLQDFDQPFRPRTAGEILERIRTLRQTDALDLILSVLNLVKGNAISPSDFDNCMKRLIDQIRPARFSKIFWPLFDAYNKRLRDEGRIDFNDMIIQAAMALEKGDVHTSYKLLLVDEFQDLSLGRSRLIKALLAQHTDSILFGVGDDWQAINGFAGSDLKLFMNFESHFGATHEGKLTKTFRCPQGIADVSAQFIQKNKAGQKLKDVKSELDSTTKDVVNLLDVSNDEEVGDEIDKQLNILANRQRATAAIDPDAKKNSIYLLSRYGLDKTKGIDEKWLNSITIKYANALDISFMTVHKAKGLEADYVFLLGLNAGMGLTFPPSMINDPLIDALLQNNDCFPYAEERRLFYVALTRAKRRCFVLFRQKSPSPFVLELMEPQYNEMVTYRGGKLPLRCSRCGKGFMVKRSGTTKPFLGCTRYPIDGCKNKIFNISDTDAALKTYSTRP